jgi:hypothetical protein
VAAFIVSLIVDGSQSFDGNVTRALSPFSVAHEELSPFSILPAGERQRLYLPSADNGRLAHDDNND